MKRHDAVRRPAHYTFGGIEVQAAIEAWELNFSCGNIVKYTVRAGRKSKRTHLQDLQKARTYIDFEIARVSKRSKRGRK